MLWLLGMLATLGHQTKLSIMLHKVQYISRHRDLHSSLDRDLHASLDKLGIQGGRGTIRQLSISRGGPILNLMERINLIGIPLSSMQSSRLWGVGCPRVSLWGVLGHSLWWGLCLSMLRQGLQSYQGWIQRFRKCRRIQ